MDGCHVEWMPDRGQKFETLGELGLWAGKLPFLIMPKRNLIDQLSENSLYSEIRSFKHRVLVY